MLGRYRYNRNFRSLILVFFFIHFFTAVMLFFIILYERWSKLAKYSSLAYLTYICDLHQFTTIVVKR